MKNLSSDLLTDLLTFQIQWIGSVKTFQYWDEVFMAYEKVR